MTYVVTLSTQDQAAFIGCFTGADSRSVDQSSSLWIITCTYCVMYIRCAASQAAVLRQVFPGLHLGGSRPGNEATLCTQYVQSHNLRQEWATFTPLSPDTWWPPEYVPSWRPASLHWTGHQVDRTHVPFLSLLPSHPSNPLPLLHSLPTLFLAECVLVYMEPEKSKELVRWAGANFTTALFVNYDPVRLVVVCMCSPSTFEIMCMMYTGLYHQVVSYLLTSTDSSTWQVWQSYAGKPQGTVKYS